MSSIAVRNSLDRAVRGQGLSSPRIRILHDERQSPTIPAALDATRWSSQHCGAGDFPATADGRFLPRDAALWTFSTPATAFESLTMVPRSEYRIAPPSFTLRDPLIVVWAPDGGAQERALRRILGDWTDVVCCHTEHEVWERLATPSARVFLVALGQAVLPREVALIGSVRARFRGVHVVGFGTLSPRLARDAVACAKAGLDQLLLDGYDDVGRALRRLLSAETCVEDIVLHEVASRVPAKLLRVVRHVLRRLPDNLNLTQVSRALGINSRTLQRSAAESGCCSPSNLIAAVRVLVALRLLLHDRTPMPMVLAKTGYSSMRALRSAMRRYGLRAPSHISAAEEYSLAREIILRFITPRESIVAIAPGSDVQPGWTIDRSSSFKAS